MKKNNKNRKNKSKSKKSITKSITRIKKEPSIEYKEIPDFTDGESYYIYNLARLAIPNKKTVIAEINGSANSIADVFFKGLEDSDSNRVVFYSIDSAFSGEENKRAFLNNIQGKDAINQSIKLLPFSDSELLNIIEDKTLDIVFIHENKGGLFQDLYRWFSKLKDDGWLSGYISPFEQGELERFALDRGLGYSIISMPLTKYIFEIYSKDIAEGLRKVKEHLITGSFFDAKHIMTRIMIRYPHSPFISNLKAELDHQCGSVNDARISFRKIIEAWPYHVRAINNLAAIEANTGSFETSKKLFRRVLELDPNNIEATINLNKIENKSI